MKPRAQIMIPEGRGCELAFVSGLDACGFTPQRKAITDVKPEDLLILWNRKQYEEKLARRFEEVGAQVIITENGYLGKHWNGKTWYSVALQQHAGAGVWPEGGQERWDGQHVELQPWREGGSVVVVLGQRGVGSTLTRQPDGWHAAVARGLASHHKVRLRPHPGMQGQRTGAPSLEEDLLDAWCVVTWASGAALRALLRGIPVFYGFEKWIGGGCCSLIPQHTRELPAAYHGDRLTMFRRLIWAQWQQGEIASGAAIKCLLKL